jgi:hypothetical protein
MNAKNIMFGVMVNYMEWSEASKYFNISVNLENKGIKIPMTTCTSDMWANLGDNYITIF